MLFNLYGDNAMWQLLGWVLVFAGLVICNEIARRTKAGGVFFFLILPLALTVYFIAIAVGAANGAEWALNNQIHERLVPLCEAVCSSSRMYWFHDAQIQMGHWKERMV